MKNYYLIINLCNIIDNLYQVEQKQPIFSVCQTYVGPCLGVRFVFEIRWEMGYFSNWMRVVIQIPRFEEKKPW
jgi:hypothetical protein